MQQAIFSLSKQYNPSQSPNDFNSSVKKPSSNLVVIDPRVENPTSLIAGLKADTCVVVLDLEQDGILKLDNLIQNYSQIDSLHLVTHGTPGNIQLGATELNSQTLQQYEEIIGSWSSVLASKSLHIYGCNVAQNDTGKIFLQRLHHLTKANIAAATHKVGNPGQGGSWDLDYQIGEIAQDSIFSSQILLSYAGTFEPVVSFSTSPDILVETEGTDFVFLFELSEPPPPEGVNVTVNSNVPESLNQLNLFAITTEGADFPVGNFDFSGFDINITSQVATLTLPVFLDDDSSDAIVNTPEFDDDDFNVTFTLQDGEGFDVDPNANSGTVSFFDTPEDVPSAPDPEPEPEPEPTPAPVGDIEVSIAVSQNTLIESEGTETTITLFLDNPPPEGGLVVDIASGVPFSLGDFDVLPPGPQATFTGGQLVQGFDDNSGFSFNITEQTATITIPIFDDEDRPADNPESTINDDIGIEEVTFSIVDGEGFDVNPNADDITLTLADNPEQLAAVDTGTVELFRFTNTNFATGTFVFVEELERGQILANPGLNQVFSLDGVQDNGSIAPGFVASTSAGDDLIGFFRLESLATPGTFLFVTEGELNNIFAEGSGVADLFERQGFDGNGNDIPEFFLFSAGSGRGVQFNRFQNNQNNTFLFAGPAETAAINNDPFLSSVFSDQGVAFGSLG